MSTTSPRLLTAEEFSRLPEARDGSKMELVRGEIVMSPPPVFIHGKIQARIAAILLAYADATQRGQVTVESGVVTEEDPDTVRGPDVAFWSVERVPLGSDPKGYPDVVPDLCVEVLSPSDRRRGINDKIAEYLACGVRSVWIIDPEGRALTIYHAAEQGQVLHESATVTDEVVLPGFSCPVSDVFR